MQKRWSRGTARTGGQANQADGPRPGKKVGRNPAELAKTLVPGRAAQRHGPRGRALRGGAFHGRGALCLSASKDRPGIHCGSPQTSSVPPDTC